MSCIIYFDESGHTGYSYLDAQQTIVAYGGLRTTEEEAAEIRGRRFAQVGGAELKHSRLSGTAVGQRAILGLLREETEWIGTNFRWFLIDKPYALLSKYVDLFVEEAAFRTGDNLYSSGINAQLVAMLWMVARANGKTEGLNRFLSAFSEFARQPDLDRLADLETEAHRLDLGNEALEATVTNPLRRLGGAFVDIVVREQLDLSMAGPWSLLGVWYKEVREPFWMVHDAGAALRRQEEQWLAITSLENGYTVEHLGAFEMPTNIPLLGTEFRDSAGLVPLQLVDIILGANRRLAEWLKADRPEDPYAAALFEILGEPQPDWSIPPPIGSLLALGEDDQTADEAGEIMSAFGHRLPPRRRSGAPPGRWSERNVDAE